MKFVEYLQTNGTQIGWYTGYIIGNDIDSSIEFDYMPTGSTGYGDMWFAYFGDGNENALYRNKSNGTNIGFCFGNNTSKKDGGAFTITKGTRYLHRISKIGLEGWSGNAWTTLSSVVSSSINSPSGLCVGCAEIRDNLPNRCISARYYKFKVTDGNGDVVLNLQPALDDSDNPCFYDKVSGNLIYHLGSGTPTYGPVISTIEVNPSSVVFTNTGGTSALTISSLNNWTASTSNSWVTLSDTAGTSSDTSISVTVSNYMGPENRNGEITFINENEESVTVSIVQKTAKVRYRELTNIGTTGNTWFVLDHKFKGDEKIKIEGVTFSVYESAYTTLFSCGVSEHPSIYISSGNSETYRNIEFYWNNIKHTINTAGTQSFSQNFNKCLGNNTIEISSTGLTIDGNVNSSYQETTDFTRTNNMVLFAANENGDYKCGFQYYPSYVGRITITDSADTVVAKYIPVVDDNGTPCIYSVISDQCIYNSGTGTPYIVGVYSDNFNNIKFLGEDCNLNIGDSQVKKAYFGNEIIVSTEDLTEKSYVSFTGSGTENTAYFYETRIVPNLDTSFEISAELNKRYSTYWYVGNRNGSGIGDYYDISSSSASNGYAVFRYGNVARQGLSMTQTVNNTLKMTNNGLTVNGTNYTGFTPTQISSSSTIKIYNGGAKIYSAKIWKDGNLVFDAVPIVNPLYGNGVIGQRSEALYDKVSKAILFGTMVV